MLCWSYIISARSLEPQGRKALYSPHVAPLRSLKDAKSNPGEFVLDILGPASRELLRWLCAILAPKPGWFGEWGGFPNWAAFCSGPVLFVICVDKPVEFIPEQGGSAPNSTQATNLLIEFCNMYNFGSGHYKGSKSVPLSPLTAGFMAALALTFRRDEQLQPKLTITPLR